MVETRGPLRSFVSVGLRLCRISSTMIVPPIRVEQSIRLKAAPTRAHLRFVKILVPEISESVVLDHNAEGQEIT
jgi:hypothetical protein